MADELSAVSVTVPEKQVAGFPYLILRAEKDAKNNLQASVEINYNAIGGGMTVVALADMTAGQKAAAKAYYEAFTG